MADPIPRGHVEAITRWEEWNDKAPNSVEKQGRGAMIAMTRLGIEKIETLETVFRDARIASENRLKEAKEDRAREHEANERERRWSRWAVGLGLLFTLVTAITGLISLRIQWESRGQVPVAVVPIPTVVGPLPPQDP